MLNILDFQAFFNSRDTTFFFDHDLLILELQPAVEICEQLPLLRDAALLEEILRVGFEINLLAFFLDLLFDLVDAKHRSLEVLVPFDLFLKFLFDAELIHVNPIHELHKLDDEILLTDRPALAVKIPTSRASIIDIAMHVPIFLLLEFLVGRNTRSTLGTLDELRESELF